MARNTSDVEQECYPCSFTPITFGVHLDMYVCRETVQPPICQFDFKHNILSTKQRRLVSKSSLYRMLQKQLYNGISNITVWRVLRRRLHLEAYKLSIVQHLEPSWIPVTFWFLASSVLRPCMFLRNDWLSLDCTTLIREDRTLQIFSYVWYCCMRWFGLPSVWSSVRCRVNNGG
jgi:hypothetical protein